MQTAIATRPTQAPVDPIGVFYATTLDGAVDASIAEPGGDKKAKRFVAKQIMGWIKAGLVVTYHRVDQPITVMPPAKPELKAASSAAPIKAFVPSRRRKVTPKTGRRAKRGNVRKTVQHFAVGETVYLFKALLNADEFTRWSSYLNHAGQVVETVSNGKGRPRTYKVRFNGDPEPILVRADQLTRGLLDE